jgi:hypothetical protein
MRWIRLAHLVPILLLLVDQNQAQDDAAGEKSPAVPIKAKQRGFSYEIQPDGSKILKHQQEGAYYRSWSGASMNTLGDRSTFTDEQGNTYEIVHSKKFAKKFAQFGEHQPMPLHEMMKRIPEESILGYETVNGFHCAVRTVLVNGEPGGKDYTYLPYGLLVKVEWMEPGGGPHQMVHELYDIEVAEPDPALVRIPEAYSVDNQPER